MSTKLAKQQLNQLIQSKQTPAGKELSKVIKKRKKQHKKQQSKLQDKQQKQQTTYQQNLQYFKATETAPKQTLELMGKVGISVESWFREDRKCLTTTATCLRLQLLGQPVPHEDDSDLDIDI